MKNILAIFFVVAAMAVVIMSAGCPAAKDDTTDTIEADTLEIQTSSFELIGPAPEDIVSKTLPSYPEWAAEEGLEKIRITLAFSLDTDGKVQPTIVVRQSSGNTDWDKEVQKVLREWKFTEAEEQRKAEITFWFITSSESGGEVVKTELAAGVSQTFELVGINPSDILTKVMPPYPSWAKEKGLDRVRITFSFAVDKDGDVQPTMVVRTTSGNTDWDKEAQKALQSWKFTKTKELRKGEITFIFAIN